MQIYFNIYAQKVDSQRNMFESVVLFSMLMTYLIYMNLSYFSKEFSYLSNYYEQGSKKPVV